MRQKVGSTKYCLLCCSITHHVRHLQCQSSPLRCMCSRGGLVNVRMIPLSHNCDTCRTLFLPDSRCRRRTRLCNEYAASICQQTSLWCISRIILLTENTKKTKTNSSPCFHLNHGCSRPQRGKQSPVHCPLLHVHLKTQSDGN